MMLIPCPWCGKRNELEFTHGGDASKVMPSENWGQSKNAKNFYSDPNFEAWYQYVYERPNPAGEHVEYWHHSYGCNKWFKLTRNTTNNAISENSKP